MKAVLCVLVSIGLLNCIRADDDGRYHPELYGDNSVTYNPINNGRYDYRQRNNFGRSGLYYPNHAYQPLYSLKPYQQLSAPLETYNKVASTISSSTALPPVVRVTTVQPPNYVYAKHYGNEGYARIIEQDNDVNDNSYQYKYKTENGISAGESGIVDPSGAVGGTRVSGFYEYIGADGLTYRVDYTADENGFHPTGAHLPKL
ncbi:larval cuticle protein LCP-30-like [Vanessa tameamea]|uniref:Larval cuticle protein LCP-30-like n=1 Tax=Vanessa tameamea TaxID=334116 RepID=A0A8B8HNC0_VANTA|nr:larval cuticle protein LCP-30-like [Vanessa tameamea]